MPPAVAGRVVDQAGGLAPGLRRPDRPRLEVAAAVRADVAQHAVDARGAEGALVGADARVRRVRGQVLVAQLAVRPQLQHGSGGERAAHRQRLVVFADRDEARLLEDRHLGVVLLHGRGQRGEACGLGALEQSGEQLVADALAAAAGHDGDRQLGGLLVDEPVARRRLAEEPEPAGAEAVALLDRDQRRVALASPAVDVRGDLISRNSFGGSVTPGLSPNSYLEILKSILFEMIII